MTAAIGVYDSIVIAPVCQIVIAAVEKRTILTAQACIGAVVYMAIFGLVPLVIWLLLTVDGDCRANCRRCSVFCRVHEGVTFCIG